MFENVCLPSDVSKGIYFQGHFFVTSPPPWNEMSAPRAITLTSLPQNMKWLLPEQVIRHNYGIWIQPPMGAIGKTTDGKSWLSADTAMLWFDKIKLPEMEKKHLKLFKLMSDCKWLSSIDDICNLWLVIEGDCIWQHEVLGHSNKYWQHNQPRQKMCLIG